MSPSNLTPSQSTTEPPSSTGGSGGRIVVAAIGLMDRRALVAASSAQSIDAGQRRAVHVALDADDARRVGLEWIAQPRGLPLDIVDDEGGVAATMAAVTERLLATGDAVELLVLVGQLCRRGISRRLLHDGTADAICAAVDRVPGAHAIALPVAIARR